MVNPISDYVKKHSGINLSVFSRLVKYFLISVTGTLIPIEPIGAESKVPVAVWSDTVFIDTLLSTPNTERSILRLCFSIEILVEELDLDEDDVRKILNALSFSFGECELNDVHDILTLNPICTRPFIKLSENEFMIVSATILNSFFMEMITLLIGEHRKAFDSFNRRRGKYIEHKTFELFKKSFPANEVYNSVYIDDTTTNEKDIILKYGDVLLIIEVKSHGIKKGVKKAGLNSLKTMLKDTIQAANKQTLGLKKSLLSGNLARVAHTKKHSFIIDPNKTTKVYRLIVLFRELGGLHTNYRNIEPITGPLGDDVFIMTLSDLMVVFEILSSPSERMDYLIQRIRLERNVFYFGDEMDLLGYYLQNRFDVNLKKYGGGKQIMLFEEQAAAIDQYKNKIFMTGSAKKPKFEIMPLWENLILILEKRLGGQSRMITSKLFRFSIDDQKEATKDLEESFLKIKYARSKDEYQTFETYNEDFKELIRFVVIKYYNMEDFDGDAEELLRLGDGKYTAVHSIYFNANLNGEYAGYMLLKPKKKTHVINLRQAIIQTLR